MNQLDVLIPHYRDPEGLELSLASVAEQTWTGDLRVIVLDDGSPASTVSEIKTLLAKQPMPVKFMQNRENLERPLTRNRLLEAVEGTYVAWLDAGDVWYPDKLARQFDHLSLLRYQNVDIDRVWVTCHFDWQWQNRKPRLTLQDTGGDQLKDLMLGQKLRAYLWTVLGTTASFRAIGLFDPKLPRLQDLDYFIRFVRAGGVLAAPSKRQALCRYHKSDVGRNAFEIRVCQQRVFEKYRSSYQSFGPAHLRKVRYNAESLAARYAKNNDEQLRRAYYLARAFIASPQQSMGLLRGWLRQESA